MAAFEWLSSQSFSPNRIFSPIGVTLADGTATSATYNTPTGQVVLTGTGFAFAGDSTPTAGAITGLEYKENGLTIGRIQSIANASLESLHWNWFTYSPTDGNDAMRLLLAENSTVFGNDGGDVLPGHGGYQINGGGGIDIATYGPLSYAYAKNGEIELAEIFGPITYNRYTISKAGSNFEINISSLNDHYTDTLSNIEAVKFGNTIFGLVQHVQFDPSADVDAIVRCSAFDSNTLILNSTIIPGLTDGQTIHITGGFLADYLAGHAGNNLLDGLVGADTLAGGAGNDIYILNDPRDLIVETAGQGYDVARTTVSYTLRKGNEIERLEAYGPSFSEYGDPFVVSLTGNEFSNRIIGNNASNRLDGKGGVDRLEGLLGDDIYYVDNKRDIVVENARGGKDTVIASTSYALRSAAEVEELRLSNPASKAAYYLYGSNFSNTIIGNAGANVIKGLGGNDNIYGGLGNDKLYGGSGRDIFVFNTKLNNQSNVDRIYDYSWKHDTIYLDRRIFQGLDKGKLLKGTFIYGTEARDAWDRIIYDDKTGALYFDIDGTGEEKQIQFAILKPKIKLNTSDFFVV